MTKSILFLLAVIVSYACAMACVQMLMPHKVALFGDSISFGSGLSPAESLPARLQATLRSHGYNALVINDSVPGESTATALHRIDAVIDHRPDLVVIEFGINDALHRLPPLEARDNLLEIERRFREVGTRFGLAGAWTARFDAREIYRGLDYDSLLDGVTFQPDGLHPDASGVTVMAERLAPVVEGVW